MNTLNMKDFDSIVLSPEDFPKNASVRVRHFDWQQGDVVISGRVIGPSSASHLRIRADDGLIFAVPVGDCDLVEGAA